MTSPTTAPTTDPTTDAPKPSPTPPNNVRQFIRTTLALAASTVLAVTPSIFLLTVLQPSGCLPTTAQQKVVHALVENCEVLDIPEKVCVAVEDLAPLLEVLLLAQKRGEDAHFTVKDEKTTRHITVPLSRIPGAVGAVTGAALGAAHRGAGSGSASASAPASAKASASATTSATTSAMASATASATASAGVKGTAPLSASASSGKSPTASQPLK